MPQKSLMPQRLPELEGWEATTVGWSWEGSLGALGVSWIVVAWHPDWSTLSPLLGASETPLEGRESTTIPTPSRARRTAKHPNQRPWQRMANLQVILQLTDTKQKAETPRPCGIFLALLFQVLANSEGKDEPAVKTAFFRVVKEVARPLVSPLVNHPLTQFKRNETLEPFSVSHIAPQTFFRLVPQLHEDMIWPESVTSRE